MDLRVSDENIEVYHAVGFPQIEYDPVLDDHIPDKLTHNSVQSDNTFNVANIQPWMQGVPVPWESRTERKPFIDEFLGAVENIFPSTATEPGPTLFSTFSHVPAAIYSQQIPRVIRPLDDSDFETSCEYCPFYIRSPYQHIQKPWTSCGKPRAGFSHTLSHLQSDHSLLRGCNPLRRFQRFVTKCAYHDSRAKGKSKCKHCNKPGRWTDEDPEDPADDTHFGGALFAQHIVRNRGVNNARPRIS